MKNLWSDESKLENASGNHECHLLSELQRTGDIRLVIALLSDGLVPEEWAARTSRQETSALKRYTQVWEQHMLTSRCHLFQGEASNLSTGYCICYQRVSVLNRPEQVGCHVMKRFLPKRRPVTDEQWIK